MLQCSRNPKHSVEVEPTKAKFCGQCGAVLEKMLTHACGWTLLPHDKYCQGCGVAVKP
jgi:hypothetical protein